MIGCLGRHRQGTGCQSSFPEGALTVVPDLVTLGKKRGLYIVRGAIVRVALLYLCVVYDSFCETSAVYRYIYANEPLISRATYHSTEEEAITDSFRLA